MKRRSIVLPVHEGDPIPSSSEVFDRPFPLYHWSPSSRRKGIMRYGLRPGHFSTDRLWRPPVICYADDPATAWQLSAGTGRGQAIDEWDLWMIWSDTPSGLEIIPYDNGVPKEYRVYERIYKKDVWFVGSRRQNNG